MVGSERHVTAVPHIVVDPSVLELLPHLRNVCYVALLRHRGDQRKGFHDADAKILACYLLQAPSILVGGVDETQLLAARVNGSLVLSPDCPEGGVREHTLAMPHEDAERGTIRPRLANLLELAYHV